MDPEEELKKLRQRLLDGEISEELYNKLRAEIEEDMGGTGREEPKQEEREGTSTDTSSDFCPDCNKEMTVGDRYQCEECERVVCSDCKMEDLPVCRTCYRVKKQSLIDHKVDQFKQKIQSALKSNPFTEATLHEVIREGLEMNISEEDVKDTTSSTLQDHGVEIEDLSKCPGCQEHHQARIICPGCESMLMKLVSTKNLSGQKIFIDDGEFVIVHQQKEQKRNRDFT